MDKLKRNYILNTLFQVLRLLTPLIVTPYISRVLGVDGVGIFSYTYSIQYYFTMFAVLGTATYGAREIARNRDNKHDISRIFWEIELQAVATTAICLIGWGAFIAINGQYQLYYTILSLYIISAAVDVSWFYIGLERFPEIVGKNIAVRVIETCSIFIFVKKPEDLYLYFIIMACGTFFGHASLWIGLWKHIEKVSLSELRVFSHLKGTLVFFLPTIATSIYTVLDKTLIGAITKEAAQNGAYEQATKIVDIAKAVSFVSLNTVIAPRSTYQYAQKNYDQVKKTLASSMNFMLFLSCGFAFGIAGVSQIFVPWFFGEGFDGVVTLLRVLSPIIIIICISNGLGYQYYDPSGRRLQSAKYLIVGACCNLVFNCALIPILKSTGAVIGSLISEAVIAALYLKNCDGYLTVKALLKLGWKKFVSGLFMFAALLFLCRYLTPSALHVILAVLAGGATYILLLVLLRDDVIFTAVEKGLAFVKRKLGKKGE